MAELTVTGEPHPGLQPAPLHHPILRNDAASEWMGIEVTALGPGHATIRMTLRQEMLNGFGMAHGGMVFAFGDTAFALACNPAEPDPAGADAAGADPAGAASAGAASPGAGTGSITVAAGVDINFLRPAYRGQLLTAVANRRASAGRSGLYDIQIYAADPAGPAAAMPGELIAEFRGRSRTIARK